MIEAVYDKIDSFLKDLRDMKAHTVLQLIKYGGQVGAMAKQILDEHKLIHYRNGQNELSSVVDLTPEGLKAIDLGIRGYLAKVEEKMNRADQIEQLTLQKLKLEQLPAKLWWIIAIGTILISAIVGFLMDLIKSKYIHP